MNCLNNNNNYKLYATCCNKYICCYVCHNKNSDHKINRFYHIKHILCNKCDTINENINNECKNCNCKFAKIFCKECLIHNDSNRDMFHCHKCKCCYYEKKEKLIHCDNCNICFKTKAIKKHKCNIINGLNKCQICLDNIFTEREKTVMLRCSHLIHRSCLDQLKLFNKDNIIKCTICSMSIYDSKKYEEEYENKIKEMPVNCARKEWKTEYLCFDCHDKNTTNYHYYYHKCLNCNSYNTNSLNTIKVS